MLDLLGTVEEAIFGLMDATADGPEWEMDHAWKSGAGWFVSTLPEDMQDRIADARAILSIRQELGIADGETEARLRHAIICPSSYLREHGYL